MTIWRCLRQLWLNISPNILLSSALFCQWNFTFCHWIYICTLLNVCHTNAKWLFDCPLPETMRRDVAPFCQDLVALLTHGKRKDQRLTGLKLLDAWMGRGSPALRLTTTKAHKLARGECERGDSGTTAEGVSQRGLPLHPLYYHQLPRARCVLVISYLVPGVCLWSVTSCQVCACDQLPRARCVLVISYLVPGVCLWLATLCQVCACDQLPCARCVLVISYLVPGVCLWSVTSCQVCACDQLPRARCVLVISYLVPGVCLWSVTLCRCVLVISYLVPGVCLWSVTSCQVCACDQLPRARGVLVISYLVPGVCLWSVTLCQVCGCY